MRVLAKRIFVLAAMMWPAAGWAQPATGAAQRNSSASDQGSSNMHAEAGRIFALANQARAEAGVGRLDWDPALADAALQHCVRLAAGAPISHKCNGEPALSTRTAQPGAHYSVIEENVAMGPSADTHHEQWMHSPGHRAKL